VTCLLPTLGAVTRFRLMFQRSVDHEADGTAQA
jgi:hypothetical protein